MIRELEKIPPREWYDTIKIYVEENDRICGVLLYYNMLEWYTTEDRFMPGTEEEWRIIDIFDALSGYCNVDYRIGTSDYHILE